MGACAATALVWQAEEIRVLSLASPHPPPLLVVFLVLPGQLPRTFSCLPSYLTTGMMTLALDKGASVPGFMWVLGI